MEKILLILGIFFIILGIVYLIFMYLKEKRITKKLEEERSEIASHGLDPEFFNKPSEKALGKFTDLGCVTFWALIAIGVILIIIGSDW